MIELEWAVLVKGHPEEIQQRVHAYFEALGVEPAFALARGRADWHVIYGTGRGHAGTETRLADVLSNSGGEVVYALALAEDEPYALAIHPDGSTRGVDQHPDDLARNLGCPLPNEGAHRAAATPPLNIRTVARLDDIGVDEARAAYQSSHGKPPAPSLHFDAVAGGVILHHDRSKVGFADDIGSADVAISEVRPEMTVYAVTTSPQLAPFMVQIIRGGEAIAHFDRPPRNDPFSPAVDDVKGSRDPAAILAALGITLKHFGF